MSTLYTNAFNRKQLEVYKKLASFNKEFVLAGATAIMLQINHRRSLDFDCFSGKPLSPSLLRKSKNVFGNLNVQVDNSDLLLFTTPEGVKVDFVYFPYAHLQNPIRKEPISLFRLADLAADKAYTIGRRATWRDYVDLFFLLKWGLFTLEQITKNAQKKFGGEFNEKLFLEQLVYYKDLEILPTEFLQEEYTTRQIQSFLQRATKEQTQKNLK